jgi:Transposase, Mutator family
MHAARSMAAIVWRSPGRSDRQKPRTGAVGFAVYTTNSIENLNRQIRKSIKTRGHFPEALQRVLERLGRAASSRRPSRARCGARTISVEIARAWTVIALRWWPTMSCSSRAIRSRSLSAV